MTEQEDNGKTIEYTYDSKTHQVSAKYIKDGEDIKFRQFLFYDEKTASLVKIIKDDGSKREYTNLDDVEERLITIFTLNDQHPIGMPKVIEEKFWDDVTKKETLLKSIKCKYKEGYLCQQDHYDANQRHRYSLYWEYDAHGNVIKEINAEGDEIIKEYDKCDNLIFEKGPRLDDQKTYAYDYLNRLVSIKHEADGHCWETQYRYDLRGNREAMIDHFRQETIYKYDEFNRLVQTVYPSIRLSETEVIQPISETEYDCNHNPITITQAGGWKTSFTYNSRGKPVTKTHANGTVESFDYNLDGTLAKWIGLNGTSTLYERDFLGRVLKKETFDGNAFIKEIYQYEIGCMNEQGEITELRVLGVGTDAEIGAAVALELYGKTFAPIHDRQGHVVCLLDSVTGKPVETYRYSAFGDQS